MKSSNAHRMIRSEFECQSEQCGDDCFLVRIRFALFHLLQQSGESFEVARVGIYVEYLSVAVD
jgi:hypothetical protein